MDLANDVEIHFMNILEVLSSTIERKKTSLFQIRIFNPPIVTKLKVAIEKKFKKSVKKKVL